MGTGARAKKMCDIDAVRRGNVLRRGSRMRAISIAAALVVALVTTAGVSAAGAQAATPTFSANAALVTAESNGPRCAGRTWNAPRSSAAPARSLYLGTKPTK